MLQMNDGGDLKVPDQSGEDSSPSVTDAGKEKTFKTPDRGKRQKANSAPLTLRVGAPTA